MGERVGDELIEEMVACLPPHTEQWLMARELIERRAKESAYKEANPLGSTARMFDAIADRIRAGDDFYEVLADYGLTLNDHGGGCPDDAPMIQTGGELSAEIHGKP